MLGCKQPKNLGGEVYMAITNPFVFLVVCAIAGLVYNMLTNTSYIA